ncbi:hypothetical protein VCHENC02_3167B, partial [Vibrio harveyi]
EYII